LHIRDLYGGGEWFSAPALPLEDVQDPTGAGDCFAGGAVGYLASRMRFDAAHLRQAMIMAIDYDQIIQKLNGGEGNKLGFPESMNSGYEDLYLSLNDASAAVKALYAYSPDKAKQLLRAAVARVLRQEALTPRKVEINLPHWGGIV
jgi:ABC-type transport system substrate-binding protein